MRLIIAAFAISLLYVPLVATAQVCPGLTKATPEGQKCLTADEEASIRATWAEHDTLLPGEKKEMATAEAVRRITVGVVVNGLRIATDDEGIATLHRMMVKAQRLEAQRKPVALRGRTRNGDKINITSAASAEALFDAASDHIVIVNAALDDLFDVIDGMSVTELKAFDVTAWSGWPAE